MKKIKPNLRKMFSFHTIVVLAVFVVLQSQTIEARHQTKHNHFSHNSNNNNNNQHYNYHTDDVKQHHRKRHHQQQLQQPPTTPSIVVTHGSAAPMNTDNKFLFKQHHIVKDVLSKTENNKSITSTTSSSPAFFTAQLPEHNDRNTQSLNSTTIASPTLSNYVLEHTYYNEYDKMSPTPMPPQQPTYLSTRHIGSHHRPNNSTSSYSNTGKSSKLNLATVDQVTNEQQQQQPQPEQHNYSSKQEYDNEQQAQHNDDDYYEDYSEDYSDVVDTDTDATSDEDDNSLSDRSYARITRSKLDHDYADDEPYRSEINDHQMQRDAAPGSLTEQKYAEVGSEKAVIHARERYIQEQKRPRTPHELATAHWHRMIQATKCRKPFPRVIPVSNNTSKHYEPYATILHRCGEDTGCCGSTASVCTVKRYEIVMVYVFSYDFNYRKEIEALPMQNHTECHCVNRGSLLHDSMPRDKRSGGAGGGAGAGGYIHQFQRLQQKQQQQTQDALANNNNFHHQHNLQNVLGCHCPRHFNVFEEDVERHAHLPRPHSVFTRKCRCDCLINNQTCLRFKHGDEGFSLEDRKCILEHNCKPPVCSYGDYNLRIGRCPGYTSQHHSQMI